MLCGSREVYGSPRIFKYVSNSFLSTLAALNVKRSIADSPSTRTSVRNGIRCASKRTPRRPFENRATDPSYYAQVFHASKIRKLIPLL